RIRIRDQLVTLEEVDRLDVIHEHSLEPVTLGRAATLGQRSGMTSGEARARRRSRAPAHRRLGHR
ncbi:MAG: hypothetical protein ACQSGP_15525, partial [Frankia sp.]